MRILIIALLLIVCARSVAQTTLITTGAIPMAIEVYDYENDQLLDISKLCSDFDIDGIPQDLVIPNRTQIRIFFPTITKKNAKDYVAYSNGKRKLSLDRYAINYKYEGQVVSNPVNESSSGGTERSFGLVFNPEEVSPSNFLKTNPKERSVPPLDDSFTGFETTWPSYL